MFVNVLEPDNLYKSESLNIYREVSTEITMSYIRRIACYCVVQDLNMLNEKHFSWSSINYETFASENLEEMFIIDHRNYPKLKTVTYIQQESSVRSLLQCSHQYD